VGVHLAYERKGERREDFIRHTVDAATRINGQDIRRCFALSVVRLSRIFIELKDGHFEHLLQQWKSRVCKIYSHCQSLL
jgi:hypothetical protein